MIYSKQVCVVYMFFKIQRKLVVAFFDWVECRLYQAKYTHVSIAHVVRKVSDAITIVVFSVFSVIG